MGLLSLETQRRLGDEDRRWRLQLGLRIFSTVLAVPAMILFATSTGLSKTDYGGNDWVDAFPLAPVLLALLYNPAHILLTVHPTLHRPIHPVWPLVVDLHIWALAIPGLVFSVGEGWFWYWQPVELSIDGDIVLCDFAFNFWSYPCNPEIYTFGKMEITANVFLALILIAHFILFIFDCIATHRYRLSKARSRRERRNIELQYHRDPEAHAADAPIAAPPAYTPSSQAQNSSRHQPSSSMSKSIVSDSENAEDAAAYKNTEAGGGGAAVSPLTQQRGGGWERNANGAPQLSSPVSPINSGSGGGFMHGEEGPFGDHAAVKYA